MPTPTITQIFTFHSFFDPETAASPRSPPPAELGSNISINSISSSSGTNKKDKKKDAKDGKKKLTKADIGTPSNFRSVSLCTGQISGH